MLEKKGRHTKQDEIRIGFDCKKSHKKIVKSILKYNLCAQEAGGEIAMIKTLPNRIKFNVVLQLVRGHEINIRNYQTQPIKHLIKECNIKSREVRASVLKRENNTNAKRLGMHAFI